jgi:(p)ppGpp synthase/HD superfamily hydrolase
MSYLIFRAVDFARKCHADHKRKYTSDDYFEHLASVATMVENVGEDHTTVAAAYLHDVVEDGYATYDEILSMFGSEVAALVLALTDVSPIAGNRTQRKALDRARLAAADPRAKTIKLADLIDNTNSIVEHDPKFAGRGPPPSRGG